MNQQQRKPLAKCVCGARAEYRQFGGDPRFYVCCVRRDCTVETKAMPTMLDAAAEWSRILPIAARDRGLLHLEGA